MNDNKETELLKWVWKAWPIVILIVILVAHSIVYHFCQENIDYINYVLSKIFQVIGGGILIIFINENNKTLKHRNFSIIITEYFNSFPLIKKEVSMNTQVNLNLGMNAVTTITTRKNFKNIEERVEDLQKQINEIYDRISECEDASNNLYKESLTKSNQQIHGLEKIMGDLFLGNIRLEIMGIILTIFGILLS